MTHSFAAGEIVPQDGHQPCHRQALLVKDVILDGRHSVGHGAQSHALDVGGVVPRAAVVVVFARGDAIVNQQREKRRRHVFGVQPFDDLVAPHLDVHEVVQLFFISLEELIKGLKLRGVARFQSDLVARLWIRAIVQGDFQDFGHVEIARQVVVLLPKSASLHATAGAAIAGVCHRFANPDHFLNDEVAVEY